MLRLTEKIVLLLLLAMVFMPLSHAAPKQAAESRNGTIAPSKSLPRYVVQLAPDIKLELVWIKGGTFVMGSSKSELGRWEGWGEEQRKVVITRPYYIAVFETTQEQYEALMKHNPSHAKGKQLPITNISWQNAMDFCEELNKLTHKTRPANYIFTLPTEAQWEYACRAGTKTALNSNKNLKDGEKCSNLDKVGWYRGNSGNRLHAVGLKRPNRWGLYDMHGNAWEYCRDYWTNKPDPRDVIDPSGPPYGRDRVKKGGGFYQKAERCRSGARSAQGDPKWYMSFRIALVYTPNQQSNKQHK